MSGGDRKKAAAANNKLRKQNLFARINTFLTEYEKVLIVGADNVGSNHMQKIRVALRTGEAHLFVGKNTMIRKCIRGLLSTRPELEALLPTIRGNVGLIFTKKELGSIKKLTDENRVESPARAGAISPTEVIVPAGNTGMEPTKTSFFQALQIATKITKGTIEIINDVKLISVGQKVGPSEAALLQMLNIRPFRYGLEALQVYDSGSVFEASVLDITDEQVLTKFAEGVKNIASLSLAVNYPTLASIPHSLLNGYKNVLSVAVATELTFKQAEKVKAYIANPTAFAVAAPVETKTEKKVEKKEEKKEEKVEEEDEDMGFGLFD